MPFLPSPLCLRFLCDHGTENREDHRQNQLLCFKSTPRAMEATLYRKPTPANRLSTTSWTKRLGQEIWTPYAPQAWRSFHCSSFISRVCQRDDENPWSYLCINAPYSCCKDLVLRLYKHWLCTIWWILETTTKNLHAIAFKHKTCSISPTY